MEYKSNTITFTLKKTQIKNTNSISIKTEDSKSVK